MPSPSSPTALVARIGEALYGPDWIGPLARLANVNDRTVRRTAQAAKDGEEYPAAPGVLAALWEALSGIVGELEGWRR